MRKLYHFFSEQAFIYRFTLLASPWRFKKAMLQRGVAAEQISYRHYLHAVLLIRCTLNEYTDYELYGKEDDVIRQYLTMYRKHRILSLLGDRHAALTITGSKKTFNSRYSDFLGREWIDCDTCTREDFIAFLKKHNEAVFKIPDAFQGRGVKRYTYTSDADAAAQFESLQKQHGLAEEILLQHESITAFNPQTVNTLRISGVCINGHFRLLGACFKTGCGKTDVDNLVRGGIGCAVDTKTGIVCSDGFDHDLKTYEKHPVSGLTFRGFAIPHWDKLLDTVSKASVLCEKNGDGHWIGWDVAITPQGAVIIEGNWNQGLTLIQCKQNGKADLLKNILKEENYKCEQC